MLILHLVAAVLAGTGMVLLGWLSGHAGWISLAQYSAGGVAGMVLSASLVVCRPPHPPGPAGSRVGSCRSAVP